MLSLVVFMLSLVLASCKYVDIDYECHASFVSNTVHNATDSLCRDLCDQSIGCFGYCLYADYTCYTYKGCDYTKMLDSFETTRIRLTDLSIFQGNRSCESLSGNPISYIRSRLYCEESCTKDPTCHYWSHDGIDDICVHFDKSCRVGTGSADFIFKTYKYSDETAIQFLIAFSVELAVFSVCWGVAIWYLFIES